MRSPMIDEQDPLIQPAQRQGQQPDPVQQAEAERLREEQRRQREAEMAQQREQERARVQEVRARIKTREQELATQRQTNLTATIFGGAQAMQDRRARSTFSMSADPSATGNVMLRGGRAVVRRDAPRSDFSPESAERVTSIMAEQGMSPLGGLVAPVRADLPEVDQILGDENIGPLTALQRNAMRQMPGGAQVLERWEEQFGLAAEAVEANVENLRDEDGTLSERRVLEFALEQNVSPSMVGDLKRFAGLMVQKHNLDFQQQLDVKRVAQGMQLAEEKNRREEIAMSGPYMAVKNMADGKVDPSLAPIWNDLSDGEKFQASIMLIPPAPGDDAYRDTALNAVLAEHGVDVAKADEMTPQVVEAQEEQRINALIADTLQSEDVWQRLSQERGDMRQGYVREILSDILTDEMSPGEKKYWANQVWDAANERVGARVGERVAELREQRMVAARQTHVRVLDSLEKEVGMGRIDLFSGLMNSQEFRTAVPSKQEEMLRGEFAKLYGTRFDSKIETIADVRERQAAIEGQEQLPEGEDVDGRSYQEVQTDYIRLGMRMFNSRIAQSRQQLSDLVAHVSAPTIAQNHQSGRIVNFVGPDGVERHYAPEDPIAMYPALMGRLNKMLKESSGSPWVQQWLDNNTINGVIPATPQVRTFLANFSEAPPAVMDQLYPGEANDRSSLKYRMQEYYATLPQGSRERAVIAATDLTMAAGSEPDTPYTAREFDKIKPTIIALGNPLLTPQGGSDQAYAATMLANASEKIGLPATPRGWRPEEWTKIKGTSIENIVKEDPVLNDLFFRGGPLGRQRAVAAAYVKQRSAYEGEMFHQLFGENGAVQIIQAATPVNVRWQQTTAHPLRNMRYVLERMEDLKEQYDNAGSFSEKLIAGDDVRDFLNASGIEDAVRRFYRYEAIKETIAARYDDRYTTQPEAINVETAAVQVFGHGGIEGARGINAIEEDMKKIVDIYRSTLSDAANVRQYPDTQRRGGLGGA